MPTSGRDSSTVSGAPYAHTATHAYCTAGRNVVLWRENAEEVWYEYSNAGG